MNTNPHISLIFVNYRSVSYLEKALNSLYSFEKERDFFEVIVVNNDVSETLLLEDLKQKFSFRLIKNSANVGFGGGNNIGAKQARGTIFGFINPDTLWIGKQLHSIGHFFDEKKDVGVLGMDILDDKKKKEIWSAGKSPSLLQLFINNTFPSRQAYWEEAGLSFPDWVSGCAHFIRKDLFSRISGFDEQFFLYFEDVDLCKRVRNLGFSVARHTDYPIIHLGGRSKHSAQLQKKHFYQSQQMYFDKHRTIWENKILQLLQLIFCQTKG
jgi:GT2 family glycosyltransferase